MKSIFELENRLDINKEFAKLIKALFVDGEATIEEKNGYEYYEYSNLRDAIDEKVFLNWKFRQTFLSTEEYLGFLGINVEQILTYDSYYIEEDVFLYFLEFLINMFWIMSKNNNLEFSPKAKAYVDNIPKILEKMNYKSEILEDRVIITKRNADVDSVLPAVPTNIAHLLLEYNDFRIKDDIKAKKDILKSIDLYLDADNHKIKNLIKGKNKELVDSFETILNNMGVNHLSDDEKYKNMSDEERIQWYDKAFLMILHGIRSIEVDKIKQERKALITK